MVSSLGLKPSGSISRYLDIDPDGFSPRDDISGGLFHIALVISPPLISSLGLKPSGSISRYRADDKGNSSNFKLVNSAKTDKIHTSNTYIHDC
jgi:hypothetical protein